MTDDKRMQWAGDILKRAQIGKLTGSVTIHFKDGKAENAAVNSYERPLDVFGSKE